MDSDYRHYEVHICGDIYFISDKLHECIAFVLEKSKKMVQTPLTEFELKMFQEDNILGRVIWRGDWYLIEVDGERI